MWQDWVNFILGILLLIFAYTAAGTTWIAIAAVLIIILSLWGALSPRKQ